VGGTKVQRTVTLCLGPADPWLEVEVPGSTEHPDVRHQAATTVSLEAPAPKYEENGLELWLGIDIDLRDLLVPLGTKEKGKVVRRGL
jgi:hypothetical protein